MFIFNSQYMLVTCTRGVKESMAESYGDCHVAERWHRRLPKEALVTLQGW